MANIVWAFATAGVAVEALCGTIAGAAVDRIGDFNPYATANTAWAFTTIGWKQRELFTALASAILDRFDELNDRGSVSVRTEWPHLKFPLSPHSLQSAYTRQDLAQPELKRAVDGPT